MDEADAKPSARTFTQKELGQISGLRAGGFTVEEIASFLKCSVSMLRRKAKKELAEGAAYVDGIVALNVIQKAMRGDKPYDIFYLKTRRGWRETHNVQPLDADGNPATGFAGLDLRPDQLGALIDALTTAESARGGAGRAKGAARPAPQDNGQEAGDMDPAARPPDSSD